MRKSKVAKLRRLTIRRDGDRYVVDVLQPCGTFAFEARTPAEVDALLEKLIEIGFSIRDFQNAMAQSNSHGKSCLR